MKQGIYGTMTPTKDKCSFRKLRNTVPFGKVITSMMVQTGSQSGSGTKNFSRQIPLMSLAVVLNFLLSSTQSLQRQQI